MHGKTLKNDLNGHGKIAKLYLKNAEEKEKEKELERMEQFKFDPTKYNIYNLTEDMQYAMANFLTETSLIYLYNNKALKL